jgi:propanediol utilization protein
MKLYRVNKLAKPGGAIIKKRHILAQSDKAAVQQATDGPDCPICDVLLDGEKVGSIL